MKEILDQIEKDLYKKDFDHTKNIFLCGKNKADEDSLRSLINKNMKDIPSLNVCFPEDIYISSGTKKMDNLLKHEKDLADSVDLIIIPLESPGTFCELGAFAMFNKLIGKIFVLMEEKYKDKISFINQGPIDLIKKKYPKNIFYYNETESDKKLIIRDLEKKILDRRYNIRDLNYNNLFNFHRYIFYLIALFQPISEKELNKLINIKKISKKHLRPSLQLLLKKRYILESTNKFILTSTGHEYIYEGLIPRLKIKNKFSGIRSQILDLKYKKKRRNLGRELKLLV